MIKVVIVEDHAIVRKGLCSFLSTEGDIKIVGEAGLGEDAISLVRKEKPDILLLDVDLPDISGIDVVQRMKDSGLSVKTIMLTMHDSVEMANHAMKIGAVGYVIKGGEPEELIAAIKKTVSGGMYLSPIIKDKMIDQKFSMESVSNSPESLSNREMQVLTGIAKGETIPEIAGKLFLSEATVKTYRRRITEKLGFKKTADVVRFCIKHGLTEE